MASNTYGAPQRRQCFASAACAMPGQRERVVLDAEVEHVSGARGRGRRSAGRRRSGRAACVARLRASPASQLLGDRLELAVAVELVAEQVPEQRSPAGAAAPRRRQPQLVDLEQPELAGDAPSRARLPRAASSAIPPAMFAPAWLCTSARCPARSRIAGGHRGGGRLAVRGRDEHAAARAGARRASPIASRSRRIRTFPGSARPPPPRKRESAPTARASASLAASARRHQPLAGGWRCAGARPGGARRGEGRVSGARARRQHRDRAVQRAHAHRQLADRVAVGVHRERAVGAESRPRAARKTLHAAARARACRLNTLRQDPRQERELARRSRAPPPRAGHRRASRRAPRACRRRRPSSWRRRPSRR